MNNEARLAFVERLFAGTGSTYDLIVNLCTLGIDKLLKRQILHHLPPDPDRIVDLAAGTGILTFAIAKRFPNYHVIGVELRAEYLDLATVKASREGIANVKWILSRAEDVRLHQPVDAITSSYLAKYGDLLEDQVRRIFATCNQYRLPPELYDTPTGGWKDFTFVYRVN